MMLSAPSSISNRLPKATNGMPFDAPRARADVADLVDFVLLSPIGFKYDVPSVAKLRRL